ncbi:MAG: hypothetical protein ACUVQ0_00780 [Thermoproteota archaeon]
MIVLLDSSALLAPFEIKVDFVTQIESSAGRVVFLAPFEALAELRRLSGMGLKVSKAAKLALSAAEGLRILAPTGMMCDDALVYLAKTYKAAVATADRALRRRLKILGITVFNPAGGRRIIGGVFR